MDVFEPHENLSGDFLETGNGEVTLVLFFFVKPKILGLGRGRGKL
jgi:hypothetical protein